MEKELLYGACYYPEHWDRKDWQEHARLMREAGLNTARMGDFAWAVMEPQEDVFDFSLFEEAIGILAGEGVKTILCTPTAGPPKWLADKYDILQRDRYGRKENWGSRREACANQPDYRRRSVRIAARMAEHFRENPNVTGWQIDNEFGCHSSTRCYCEHCRVSFGRWLEKKYGTIEALNKAWGTVFWSLQYHSFEDIILPVYNSCEPENAHGWSHNPSLDLEYRRFASDSWVAYQKLQIDALRQFTDKPVTHNFMGHFSDIDYYQLAKDLDFVSWDNYPQDQWGGIPDYEYVSMAHEIMRGVKNQNFIVMEEQSGPCGWDVMGAAPEPGQLRLWAYQAAAHGAEGIVYFRFKAAPFGMEQYWYGILDQDGIPRRRYYEICRTGQEFRKLKDYIADSRNQYQALIVKSYDNVWSHEIKHHARDFNYQSLLYSYYKANADWNIPAAVSMGGYEDYRVVYLPAYNVVDPEELQKIEKYVKNGGTLVTTYRSGTRKQDNTLYTDTLPCALRELAGIEVEEFDVLRKKAHVSGVITSECTVWCEVIEPVTAKVLCTYSDRFYQGRAAVTVNTYGKGRVYYIGCDLEQQAVKELVRYISQQAGITVTQLPEGIELVQRENCRILMNHNDTEVSADITGRNLLTGEAFDGKLAAYDAVFLA